MFQPFPIPITDLVVLTPQGMFNSKTICNHPYLMMFYNLDLNLYRMRVDSSHLKWMILVMHDTNYHPMHMRTKVKVKLELWRS